jgi:replicative DNA helicase
MDAKYLEKLMMKACMADKSFMITVGAVFRSEYFDDPSIIKVFEFMKEHVEKYGNVPPKDAIIATFPDKADDLRELFEEVESIDFDVARNWDYLFDETNKYLKDKAVKSAILESVEIINQKPDERGRIREVIEAALCKDLKIDIGLDYFNTLGERLKRIFATSLNRIPTYYPQFDEYLNGGFPPFTFSVVVARVHGFKSNTLANFAARQTLHGHNVVLCSLEMSEDAFAQRFDSIFTSLDINKMYTVESVRDQLIVKLRDIKRGTENLGRLFIKQFPTGEASVLDIRRYLRELTMRGFPPSICYLDYINIMKPSYNSKGDMYTDVKRIAEEARAMSFQFECPIVSVSQLNREGSIINFAEVDFVYIAESMGVPATADFMAIYGVDDDKLVYSSELHYKIVKNRLGGRVGEIDKFYYDCRSLKMYDTTELDLWLRDATQTGDERNVAQMEARTPTQSDGKLKRGGRR